MISKFVSNKSYNPYNLVPAASICTDSFGNWISTDFVKLFTLIKLYFPTVILNSFQDLRIFEMPKQVRHDKIIRANPCLPAGRSSIRGNLTNERRCYTMTRPKVGSDAIAVKRAQVNLSFPYWVLLLVTASFFIGQSFLIVGR